MELDVAELPKDVQNKLVEVREAFYKVAPKVTPIQPDKEGRIAYHSRRLVLLNSRVFVNVADALEKYMGPAMRKKIIYEFGEKAGLDIARMFGNISKTDIMKMVIKTCFDMATLEKLKGTSPEEQVSKVLGYGKYAGWIGDAFITHFDSNTGKMRALIRNTFESNYYKSRKVKEPSCHFIAGVAAGLVQGFTDEKVRVEEVKCSALGDEYCEFVSLGEER